MSRELISLAAVAALGISTAVHSADRAAAPTAFELNAGQLEAVTAGAHDSTTVQVLPLADFIGQMQLISSLADSTVSDGAGEGDRHTPFYTNYRPQFYIR